MVWNGAINVNAHFLYVLNNETNVCHLKSVVIWRWSRACAQQRQTPHLCNKSQQPRLNEILLCEWSYILCYFSGVCSFFWFDKLNSDDPDTLQYDVVPVIVSSRMFLSSTAIPRPLRNATLSTMPSTLICGSVRARGRTDSISFYCPENVHFAAVIIRMGN